jgi:hypothetical protein
MGKTDTGPWAVKDTSPTRPAARMPVIGREAGWKQRANQSNLADYDGGDDDPFHDRQYANDAGVFFGDR